MSIPAQLTTGPVPDIEGPRPPTTVVESRPKRRRLNHACNYCRSRKVKCDEQEPCHACSVAGLRCITVDRRRPGVHVARREAGSGSRVRTPRAADSVATFQERQDLETPTSPEQPRSNASSRSCNEAGLASTRETRRPWSAAPEPDAHSSHPIHGAAIDDLHAEVDPVKRITRFSGRLPILEPSSGASTPELLTDWLDLALHRLGVRRRLRPDVDGCLSSFQQPMVAIEAPKLPDCAIARIFTTRYLEEANAVFPLLDADHVSQMVCLACERGPDWLQQDRGFLATVSVYLVLAIGTLRQCPEKSLEMVDFCKPFVGHIIGFNSLHAVQTMFLLALALKLHDQIVAAKSTLDLCVSIAISLGLDRMAGPGQSFRRVSGSLVGKEIEGKRTWWCIYCFERLFSFELGRPSQVTRDALPSLDVSTWSYLPSGRTHPRPEFMRIVGQLAKLFGEIGLRSAQSDTYESTADSKSMEAAIRLKLVTTGEMIMLLKNWAESLPEEYRPGSDAIHKEDTFASASFISLQYYHALLLLTRNGLLVSDKALRMAVETVAKGKPWEHVIRCGPLMAASTARKIVQLLIAEADYGYNMLLPSMTAPLHAIYLLSVNIIRQPTSRIVRSDLSLIQDGADFARQQYKTGHRLEEALKTLEDIVATAIDESTTAAAAAAVPQVSQQTENQLQSQLAANDTMALNPSTNAPRPQEQASSSEHSEGMRQEQFAASGNMLFANNTYIGQLAMGNADLDLAAFADQPSDRVLAPFNPYMNWDWADFAHIFPEEETIA